MTLRILPAVLLLGACTAAPATLTDAGRASAAEEVRAATSTLQAALNAHDPGAIFAHYRLDPAFTYVGCTNYMFGGDLFRNIVGAFHRQNAVPYAYAVQALQVLSPGSAVVALQGEAGDLQMFVTRVLEKDEAGRWLVVHEHESWPGCSAPAAPHPGTAPGDTVGLGSAIGAP